MENNQDSCPDNCNNILDDYDEFDASIRPFIGQVQESFEDSNHSENFNPSLQQERASLQPVVLSDSMPLQNAESRTPNHPPKMKPISKNEKDTKKAMKDYKKNICGYITKKIMKEFIGNNFIQRVNRLCEEEGATFEKCKQFYQGKVEKTTGPSHIPPLLVPENEGERPIKKVFLRFFQWFLKERYVRLLLLEGKMEQKAEYITYKNRCLYQIVKAQAQNNHL